MSQQQVKVIEEKHLGQLSDLTDLIVFYQQQHTQIAQQIEMQVKTREILQLMQREHNTPELAYLITHNETSLQGARFQYLTLTKLIEMLQQELATFLQKQYHIDLKKGWHLDLPHRVVYRKPEGAVS